MVLIKPALEMSGQSRHDKVGQLTFFQKAEKVVGVETCMSSYPANAVSWQGEKFYSGKKLGIAAICAIVSLVNLGNTRSSGYVRNGAGI